MNYFSNLVSIVVPVHNGGQTLEQCIESVLTQTYEHFELLLCLDNCNDDSADIAAFYAKKDSRVAYFELGKDEGGGAARTRNYGIENAKGRFLAFLDCDDFWESNKLKHQISEVYQGFNFIYTAYRTYLDEMYVGEFLPKKTNYNRLLKTCDIGCSTVLIDRDVFPDIIFPIIAKEDYALWLDMFSSGKIKPKRIKEKLVTYRLSSSSVSSNKFLELKRQFKVLRKIAKLNFIHALWCIVNYAFWGLIKHNKQYR
ncbi:MULTISPECIES: glycosyltransferase family 2 protein [Vibrio]|uniref:glycosyltransferase family 2 protein n=1 Tax=Vibrio TaxID=662 RepID=UPI0020C19F26|nr:MULTISPECIES: glycosyltransferase family 2 protein [Vibrio]MDW2326720.1 glycosyltransferase family 2 protein [Vibrio sp. 1401]